MKNRTVLLFSVALMGCIVLFFLFRPSCETEVQKDLKANEVQYGEITFALSNVKY